MWSEGAETRLWSNEIQLAWPGGYEMKHKPFEIPKRLIYEAWKSVKRAAGGAGVDGITIDTYEQKPVGKPV